MSKDIGKILLAKTDTIVESWIDSIQQDINIESSKGLAYKSVRNSIPLIIEALATLLSQSLPDREQKLKSNSWEHGIVRAEQGYDVSEIVREYGLLRKIIFTVLKPDLLASSGEEILQIIELIDSIIDRVVTLSLETYVETRLQELEQLQSQLLLTNQELNRLVAMQKEEVSYLVHELKTPLNSIMGFSSLLLQQQQKVTQEKDTALSLQFIERLISNSRQLLRLINNILEISRYESGNIQLNPESTDVCSLIQGVIQTLKPAAGQKDLKITLNCNCTTAQIITDTLRLQQIITNLVSNAIRYTETGVITVTCQTNNLDQWSLIVADTGIGMSLEAQKQVFQPYYQVNVEDSYSKGSTGLGLAIVAKLVQLLQGKIDLVSKPDEGSTFTLTFPIILSA
ncbi:MAG TPA: sensor histidine kinase [Xenococcaceae cyanobacterium]